MHLYNLTSRPHSDVQNPLSLNLPGHSRVVFPHCFELPRMERGNSSPSLHILRTPPIPCPEVSIYQRFTPNLADHPTSLTEATRKAAPDVVKWTNRRKDDFVYLCSALAGKYWLHDPSHMTVKFCNSSFSNKALYVVLCPRRFIFSNGSHSGLRNLNSPSPTSMPK